MTSRLEQVRIATRVRLALRDLARADRLDEEGRAARQAAQLAALRSRAVAGSPLYRSHHAGLERAPLHELPTVTKADVVDRFDELVTDRRLRQQHLRALVDAGAPGKALGRYRVGASSGSSGRPGLFAFDEAEWVGLIANAARARAIAGRPDVDGPVRTARIGSPSPWHPSRQLATTLQDPRKPSITLSAADGIPELVTRLGGWRPHILSGYPSLAAALADEQLAGRLDIDPVQVFTGGERLGPGTRERIRAAWQVEPFDQYLTTEAGFVAIECPEHDGLHVLDDHVIVEVVDGHGAPAAPGTFGERVLITVLGSRTLPLIRYELGDAAAWAGGPCACGRRSPRLHSIASGTRSLLRLRGPDGADVQVHPVTVTAVLDPAPVRGWQVVIAGPDRLRLLVTGPEPSFRGDALGMAMGDALERAGTARMHVDVEVVEHLVRAGSGKASSIISGAG